MTFRFLSRRKDRLVNPGDVEDRRTFRMRLALAVLSGCMLGAAFPPSRWGTLACGALVPLLIALMSVRSVGSGLRIVYAGMFVFHVLTLNWTGGYVELNDPYMAIAGALTMVVHPVFYFIPFGLFFWVRNRFGGTSALLAFPFLWVMYEYSHTLTEWSFPWLTLGNTQTFDLARIQIASLTGVYGLSFWVILLNVLLVFLYRELVDPAQRTNTYGFVFATLFLTVFMVPWIVGSVILRGAATDADHPAMDRGTIRIGIVQPNTDPWEKWAGAGIQSVQQCFSMTAAIASRDGSNRPDLVFWPETAIPYYITLPINRGALDDFHRKVNLIRIPILTGAAYYLEFADSTTAPYGAKRSSITGDRYQTFNAAMLFEPDMDSVAWQGKMKMVPLAERVPYQEWFSGLQFLQWGVGLGGWNLGPRQVVFQERTTGARFAVAVCYESVYPDFMASSVRAGAEFLSIITIDSWWDHMSGAYQHERYAVLRAVENRRWVARCAAGGISCFIDPYGRIADETTLFTKAAFSRSIGRSTELTFYSLHGEWFALLCVSVAGAWICAGLVQFILTFMRKHSWSTRA